MNFRTFGIIQLAILTAAHCVADLLTGLIPGFLPVLREQLDMSIGSGVLFITICSFSSNMVQLFAGSWGQNRTKVLYLPVGLGMAGLIAATGLVAKLPGAVWFLYLLAFIVGSGAALVHPEGLRGVCGISEKAVPPATATSVFMLFGYMGFAVGPFVGGTLVEWRGLSALWLLFLILIPLLILVCRGGIKLCSVPSGKAQSLPQELTFPEIFAVAVFINTGCNLVSGLLPSYLNTLSYSLSFGGGSAMLFGLGSGLGAFFMSFLVRKREPIPCLTGSIGAGAVLLALYLAAADSPRAVLLALFAGLGAGAGFPILVTLARQAKRGPASMGKRMGLIVGGTWSAAGLIFLGAGQLANAIGIARTMALAPVSFFIAAALMFCFHRRHKRATGGRTR